ncbi:MAG: DUF4381 domain-containing protein [Planctomycetaceae bacterium]|nr:DUF4381 domain-containing protein [Planctomycetaceae bacterium]
MKIFHLRSQRVRRRSIHQQPDADCKATPELLRILLQGFAWLFITFTGAANADSTVPTVQVNTSSTTVQVAEPFTFEINVTAPAGTTVYFPSIGELLGKFDVVDQQVRADVPSASDVNQRLWTQHLTLESIVTGELDIPSLEMQVRRDNKIQTLKTDAVPVRVTSVLEDRADPTKFRDIASVVDIAVPEPVSRAWIWWTLGGCGGIGTAALMLAAMSKRKTWMTPKVWALHELKQLRHSEAMRSADSQLVTEILTSVLRDYLELQFEIAGPLQTTQEFLHEIETHRQFSAELAEKFMTLFENADLVRFAGLKLSAAELNAAIDDTERLIELSAKLNTGQPLSGPPDNLRSSSCD